jgi:hypothetical protein
MAIARQLGRVACEPGRSKPALFFTHDTKMYPYLFCAPSHSELPVATGSARHPNDRGDLGHRSHDQGRIQEQRAASTLDLTARSTMIIAASMNENYTWVSKNDRHAGQLYCFEAATIGCGKSRRQINPPNVGSWHLASISECPLVGRCWGKADIENPRPTNRILVL